MIDAEGGIAEVIEADVTNEESCRKAVARTVQMFGTVHILVNVGTSGFFAHPWFKLVAFTTLD